MPPRRSIPRQLRTSRDQRAALQRTALEEAGLGARKRIAGRGRSPISRDVSAASQEPARLEANQQMSFDTALALQAAKDGDDSVLLPYQPTPSINPPRPRTLAAGYDRDTQTLRIRFREGAVYAYNGVSQREWANFRRVKSPGRFVNRVLNHKDYYQESWQ
jgi:hypothetical protein